MRFMITPQQRRLSKHAEFGFTKARRGSKWLVTKALADEPPVSRPLNRPDTATSVLHFTPRNGHLVQAFRHRRVRNGARVHPARTAAEIMRLTPECCPNRASCNRSECCHDRPSQRDNLGAEPRTADAAKRGFLPILRFHGLRRKLPHC